MNPVVSTIHDTAMESTLGQVRDRSFTLQERREIAKAQLEAIDQEISDWRKVVFHAVELLRDLYVEVKQSDDEYVDEARLQ